MAKFEVYATIFVLAIIFTICDVVVSTAQLTIPSLIFSSTTAVIGFIGAYMGQAIVVEEKYTEAVTFIKKNFGFANIVLSLLDVVCCILALLTGVFMLMLVFRCTIALRVLIYINKYKTVAYAVLSVVFLHVFKKTKRKVTEMTTKNTKLQTILGIIVAVFGFSGLIILNLPVFTGTEVDWSHFVGMFQEMVAVVSGFALYFTHDQVVSEDEIKAKKVNAELKEFMKQAEAEYEAQRQIQIKAIAEQRLNEQRAQEQANKQAGA